MINLFSHARFLPVAHLHPDQSHNERWQLLPQAHKTKLAGKIPV